MKKAEKYNSKIIDAIIKETSLETLIRVSNEMIFIELITELGYREDKMWTEEEDKVLTKLFTLAEKHTKKQMKTINEFYKNKKK